MNNMSDRFRTLFSSPFTQRHIARCALACTLPLALTACGDLSTAPNANPLRPELPEAPGETLNPTARAPVSFDDEGVLGIMGFSAEDDAVAAAPVSATFDAVPYVDGMPIVGSATVTIDGVATALLAATQTETVDSADIVYLSFFNDVGDAPYSIVAVKAELLATGASIPFGNDAALIVIDEANNSGIVSTEGTLLIGSYDAETGALSGSLSADTAELTLLDWPQSLLPLSASGDPLDTAAGSASGSFSAVLDGEVPVSDLLINIDGGTPFSPSTVVAEVVDTYLYLQFFAADSRRLFGVTVQESSVVSGATIALGTFDAGAYLLEETGELYAFTSGTFFVDSADLTSGGAIVGSVDIAGEAYVVPQGEYGGNEEEWIDESCAEAFDISDFAPDALHIDTAADLNEYGGLPDGFDRLVQLTELDSGDTFMFIVAEGTVLTAGTTIDLAPVDMGDDRIIALAALATDDCDVADAAFGGSIVINSWTDEGALDIDVTLTLNATEVNFQVTLD